MSAAKKLGPPKGAGAAVEAATAATEADRIRKLSSRYQDDRQAEAVTWPTTATPTPVPALERATPARPPRVEPDGMTRRTYYLPTTAAETLDAAVKQIQAATGNQVSKHAALAALIAAGVGQVDEVTEQLRGDLLRALTGE